MEYDIILLNVIEEALSNSIENGYGEEDKNMSDKELSDNLYSVDYDVEQRIMAILEEHVKQARKKYHA